jgi:hypothetical protein
VNLGKSRYKNSCDLAGFRQIAERIRAGGGGTTETFDLREDVPDPVAVFASPANLSERGVVARRVAGLGFVEAFERHDNYLASG